MLKEEPGSEDNLKDKSDRLEAIKETWTTLGPLTL